jgi:tRNA U34 5-carboxymethylaminomethyl modifying GTPase MnmE/TrmE
MPEYIDEDEALEERYTPAQPAFTSTGMSVSIRGDIFGGLQFEASNIIDDTTDEGQINERIDMMRRMFERQRTVVEHRMTRSQLAFTMVELQETPGMITKWTQERAHKLAVERAKWEMRWNRDRRGDFRQSAAQTQWLDQFEDETKKKLDEYEAILRDHPAKIANLKDRMERCERVMRGAEKTDLLDDLFSQIGLPEAAE